MIFKNIRLLQVTQSTNSLLKAEAEAGVAGEGWVVRAEHQTAGRGRLDRTWDAPPGLGLLLSALLYPRVPVSQISLLALLASLAVLDALQDHHEQSGYLGLADKLFTLKWPNDILAQGQKICGILCESGINPQDERFVIVGIGLNVNQAKTDFAPEYRDHSTSLCQLYGEKIGRDHLQSLILHHLELYYQKVKVEGGAWIAATWMGRAHIVNRSLTVNQVNRTLTGTCLGLDRDGALLLRNQKGERIVVYSGDVRI